MPTALIMQLEKAQDISHHSISMKRPFVRRLIHDACSIRNIRVVYMLPQATRFLVFPFLLECLISGRSGRAYVVGPRVHHAIS